MVDLDSRPEYSKARGLPTHRHHTRRPPIIGERSSARRIRMRDAYRRRVDALALWALLVLSVALSAAPRDLRLVDAVERRDQQAVRALLAENVDVNASQADGATPLH